MFSPRLTRAVQGIAFGLVLLFTLSVANPARADAVVSETPQDALQLALDAFLDLSGSPEGWSLGEIFTHQGYAYTIAYHADLNSEDGFALLLAIQQEDGMWHAIAPEIVPNETYNQWLLGFPDELLDEFDRSFYYRYDPLTPDAFTRVLTGYRLPWPVRENARLTQKTGTNHVNQLDWVVKESDHIYATKPGRVVFVKEVSNRTACDFSIWPYANVVVVEHGPGEYSWYYHLKKDSVPVSVGDIIGYGTMIGEQGNTGYACGTTGIHLHFMVSTAIPSVWPDPVAVDRAPWPPAGTIVPVDFSEVAWANLVVYNLYRSSNAPAPWRCEYPATQTGFYNGTYCSGSLLQTNISRLYTLETMGLEDQFESIAMMENWSASLYKNPNESGPTICLNNSDEMLWDNTWDSGGVVANQTTWVRLFNQPNCPPSESGRISLYTGAGYTGERIWSMRGVRYTNGPGHLVSSASFPDGWSVVIWTADDRKGTRLCLPGSTPNLQAAGWPEGAYVESMWAYTTNVCEAPPPPPPLPVPSSPADGTRYYIAQAPELCWGTDSGASTQNIQFYVEVAGAASVNSGWIAKTCWQPAALDGSIGTYTWRVKARNTVNQESAWSSQWAFRMVMDTIAPKVSFIVPVTDGYMNRNLNPFRVYARDAQTGIAGVYFYVWYDDLSGTGYAWHYLGEDITADDGWTMVWNSSAVTEQTVAVWAFVQDNAGNFGAAFVTGVRYDHDIIFADGFESGNLKSWSAYGGNVQVVSLSGESSPYRLAVNLNERISSYVHDIRPPAAKYYNASFTLDTSSLSLGEAEYLQIFQGYAPGLPLPFYLQLIRQSGVYRLRAVINADGTGYRSTPWQTLTEIAMQVRMEWSAASAVGASDGYIKLYLNGVLAYQIMGVDNDTYAISSVRLGVTKFMLAPSTLPGILYLDDFYSSQ